MKTVQNALAPLDLIVRIVGALTALLIVVGTIALMNGASFMGFGAFDACVDAPSGSVTFKQGEEYLATLASGASVQATSFNVCTGHPSNAQIAWQIGTMLPGFAFFLGFVVMTWLVLRTARLQGLFTPHVALKVSHLGIYLFAGSLAVSGVEAWASANLLGSMADTEQWRAFLQLLHIHWAVLIAGVGLITVGRTLAHGVVIQREIDATV